MIIREFAFAFARHTGIQPTPEQRTAVEVDICGQFGGERLYIRSAPKARRQQAVAMLIKGAAKTQRELAREGGMSERSLRRALNGK